MSPVNDEEPRVPNRSSIGAESSVAGVFQLRYEPAVKLRIDVALVVRLLCGTNRDLLNGLQRIGGGHAGDPVFIRFLQIIEKQRKNQLEF